MKACTHSLITSKARQRYLSVVIFVHIVNNEVQELKMISAFCYSDNNDKSIFTCSCMYSWRDIDMNLYFQFENDETMKKEIQDRKMVELVFSLFWFAKMIQQAFSFENLSVCCHNF
jgi:hypothetical protein